MMTMTMAKASLRVVQARLPSGLGVLFCGFRVSPVGLRAARSRRSSVPCSC